MNGRGWSADEIAALRRLVAAGWTDARIGEALDRARETVQRKRAALQLKPGQSDAMTAAVWRLKARQRARNLP
jgi:DNA-binding NarL/FixJ family response regulator